MSAEQFDIFDQNNKSLGRQRTRDEVHKYLKDWHRATHIWIFNNKHQILCQQRSLEKDSNPGKWQSFFGGHLKAGETYEQSALKELKEELGIKINSSCLEPLYIRKSDTAKHFSQVYVLKLDKNISEFSFDDNEVEKVEWFEIKDLKKAINKQEFCNSIDEKVISYINK